MGLLITLKDPSNGLRNNAYLKKHSITIECDGHGRIEMEAFQSQEARIDENTDRMSKLLTLKIGDGEICMETTDKETEKVTRHEITQIDYADIKVEYDALWAKIYGIIKKNKINYNRVETDLTKSVDVLN